MSSSDDDVPLKARALKKGKVTPDGNKVKREPTSPKSTPKAGSKPVGDAKAKKSTAPKDEGAAAAAVNGGKAQARRAKSAQESDSKRVGKIAANVKEEQAPNKPRREKAVFELPGQRRVTPPEDDPLRKFYTSLRQQRPDSAMAATWLLHTGLLPPDEIELVMQKQNSLRSPAKAANNQAGKRPRKQQAEGSTPAKPKKAAAAAAQNGSSRSSAPKQAASAKKASPGRKKKPDWSSSEEDGDASEEEDDVPLAKRQKAAKVAAHAPMRKPLPASKPAPKRSRDAAFTDGGLDSDSEDDIPLGQRRKAA